ncbi:hypothetical protein, variant [Aphanomyces astaci]|nr:hypothetical protein, variant [Aphanomyces astaci]ETV70804.1 hypothetical protein, variant [Aphanomyces astaci]|eukprot:XP_009839867.1 hypothetical protein, variant [Aphanomyces astaci]
MTAVYYICIMVVLIVIATVVPRYLYDRQHPNDAARNDDTADDFPLESPSRYNASSQTNGGGGRMSHRRYQRQHSGYDFVNGSRMYYFLRQRYKREGWSFRFNLVKQFALWKSFEVLAYNVCQYRSGYLYKNPAEMQRIFNLSVRASHAVDFGRFNTLCTRNMLATLTKLHYSAFFILVLLVMATGLLHATSIYLYMAFAALLCAMNFVIMIKTLRILKGIVKDRLRIFSLDDIERMLPPSSTALVSPPRHAPRKPPSLKVVAQLVRALVRMQMSVLCHRQLHSHDARFWLRSPAFLLRLFQFATTGHAFYLVWLTLVVAHDPLVLPWMYFLMLTFPIVSMLVITPLTMPSLVLVMSLTGFFVEQNPSPSHDDATTPTSSNLLSAKDRIRVARRSYLRSTDDCSDVIATSPVQSPANSSTPHMLLHMYDGLLHPSPLPSPRASSRGNYPNAAAMVQSPVATSMLMGTSVTNYAKMQDEDEDVDCVGGASTSNTTTTTSTPWTVGLTPLSTRTDTNPIKMFEKYCSSYGGYPSQPKPEAHEV